MATQTKHYFFDVKQDLAGGKYLAVSQTKLKHGDREKQRLTIAEEHLAEFVEQFLMAVRAMAAPDRLAAIRVEHPKAYEPWTAELDLELWEAQQAGSTVEELMERFGRQRGGIESRLKKLAEGSGKQDGVP